MYVCMDVYMYLYVFIYPVGLRPARRGGRPLRSRSPPKQNMRKLLPKVAKNTKNEAEGLQNGRKMPSGVPKCGHGAPEVIFGTIWAPFGRALGPKRWPKGGQNGAKSS